MALVLIKFFLSTIVIVCAGIFLTRFADKIAELTGLGRMFVGGLLLAGATSVPELMVDLESIQMNLPDLAVGDLLGSSLFNLLILSILDFSFPSAFRRTAFSPDFIHHALSAVMGIALTSIIGIGITTRLEVSFLGVSLFAWAAAVIYFFGLRLIFLESQNTNNTLVNSNSSSEPIDKFKSRKLFAAICGYVASSIVIMIAAPFLVVAADELSRISGLGNTFVGTTLVALSTSLPELVSTLTAFRMGNPDLALGNIFGSNAFNMLLFIPLDFIYPQSLFTKVSFNHVVTAFSVIVTTSIGVIGQLYRKKERAPFAEPSSEIVVALIFIFLILLYNIKLA